MTRCKICKVHLFRFIVFCIFVSISVYRTSCGWCLDQKKPRLDSIQDKAKEQQARSEAREAKKTVSSWGWCCKLPGGFIFFFKFHPYLGEWSNWTDIFLDGLKPPTSKDIPQKSLFLKRYISICHVLPRLYIYIIFLPHIAYEFIQTV